MLGVPLLIDVHSLRTFMETDPKGQLGGLECTDDMRRRMALESQSWKCASCGKTNAEILRACEEAARVADSTGAAKVEEVVPTELKMGWKDEMGAASASGEKADGGVNGGKEAEKQGNDESDELAEGFVQTVPIQPAAAQVPYQPARPPQSVPQPTPTIPLPPAPAALALQQQQRRSNDGVPEWVDKAILGVVACLVVMVLKMLLGL